MAKDKSAKGSKGKSKKTPANKKSAPKKPAAPKAAPKVDATPELRKLAANLEEGIKKETRLQSLDNIRPFVANSCKVMRGASASIVEGEDGRYYIDVMQHGVSLRVPANKEEYFMIPQ